MNQQNAAMRLLALVVMAALAGGTTTATAATSGVIEPASGTARAVATDDTFVELEAPKRVAGSLDKLVASSTTSSHRTILLKLKVPAVPSGSVVKGASLRLAPLRDQVGEIRVHALRSSDWNEATVTASTAPAVGSLLGSTVVAKPVSRVSVALTASMTPGTIRSFALRIPSGSNSFASTESAGGAPELVLSWQRVAPAAPVLSGSAVGDDSFLTWTATSGATSYTVTRGDGTVAYIGSGTNYIDADRPLGSSTGYRVHATGPGGSSAPSNTTVVTIAPSSPTLSGSVTGGRENALTWTASPGAASYSLTRGDGVVVYAGPSTAFVDPDRPLGSSSEYLVVAENAGGTSGESNRVTLSAAPAAPTLTAATEGSQNTVTWSDAAGATHYSLLRGGVTIYTGTDRQFVDNARPAGSTAVYEVWATNATGSTSSAPVQVTTPTAKTLFGTSNYVNPGETTATAFQRRIRDYGTPAVVRVFFAGNPGSWTTLSSIYGTTPMNVSFKADPREVLSGKNDEVYRNFFARAPKDRTTWWTYYHEPEDEAGRGEISSEDYRAAWEHIDQIADSVENARLQSTLVLMCWSLNPKSGRTWTDYYNAAAIDVVAWDCYNTTDSGYKSPEAIFGPALAAAKQVGKPWAIAEWGSQVRNGDTQGRAAWIRDSSRYLYANDAVYASYWDALGGTGADMRLSDAAAIAAQRAVQSDQLP